MDKRTKEVATSFQAPKEQKNETQSTTSNIPTAYLLLDKVHSTLYHKKERQIIYLSVDDGLNKFYK